MKNKITDLNVKQVKSKDNHFKEFKITYKYKGKPISDFRAFDKNINKSNNELLKIVTKEANDNLKSGRLIKYAHKFTGFTKMMTTVCVVGGVGAATAVVVPTTMVLLNNSNNVNENLTLTLNAGDGYFGEATKKQYVISNIEPGKTLKEVLAADDKYVDPTTDVKLTPQGETTAIPYHFVNYIDESGKAPADDFVINTNVTLNASYDLDCLSFEVPMDSTDDVKTYLKLTTYTTSEPNVKFSSDPTGAWTDYPTSQANAITIAKGSKIYVRGNNPSGFSFGDYDGVTKDNTAIFKFEAASGSVEDVKVNGNGNVMSLLDNGACTTTAIPSEGCFRYLFYNCKILRTAPDFPATTLNNNCYAWTFYNCLNLKKAPDLLATNLPDYCYYSMFRDCDSLVNPPIIAATSCESIDYENCSSIYSCAYMFTLCDNLKYSPELFITSETLEGYESYPQFLYRSMFAGCSKLELVKVHFGKAGSSEWYDDEPFSDSFTYDWLGGSTTGQEAENTPTFIWKGNDEVSPRDKHHVLDGWIIQTLEE